MQVNSRFDSFQKYTYSQTWSKIQMILWVNTFSPSNIYVLVLSDVYSLSVEFFDALLSLKI